MSFAISLVVIIVIVSLFGTVLVARNVEENYGKSTKRNVKNLSTIYIILFRTICWSNVVCGSDLIEKTNVESNGGV